MIIFVFLKNTHFMISSAESGPLLFGLDGLIVRGKQCGNDDQYHDKASNKRVVNVSKHKYVTTDNLKYALNNWYVSTIYRYCSHCSNTCVMDKWHVL